MKNKSIYLALLGALIVFTTAFVGGSQAEAADKKYTIGTDLTFAPFEFKDSSNKTVGIDIDLLNAIAKDQNFDVDIKSIGFDSAIQQVQAGQIDGMIAGMTITDERKKSFDFSDPYFDSGIVMAISGENKEIKEYKDLKGKTVGAKVGTESATFIEKNKEKYGYNVKLLDTADTMYDMLYSGNLDAIFDDYPVIGYAITQGKDLKMVTDYERGGQYGFAVKKGTNPELIKKFNAGLKKLKANGTYDKILAKYIKSETTTKNTTETSIKPVKDEYVIGTDITFAPFEFSATNGEYQGIDIELLNAIAKNQGFTVKIQPIGFDTAVQQVQANQIDGMIAGMTITDERKKSFDFSSPYFDSGIVMAVAKKNKEISTYKDLKGKTVGAKVGTESADFIQKNKDKYGYKVKLVDTTDTMYQMIASGNMDAIFDDYPVIGYAVKQGQPLKMVTEKEKGGSYGFAVKKGTNPELIAMFNQGLKELKANGDYDKILNKYIDSAKKKDTAATVDESTFGGLLKNNYPSLLSGLGKTLSLTFISFAIAVVIGVLFGLMNVSNIKLLRFIATVYIDIIRGIPLLVLAMFIFIGIPNLAGFKINEMTAGIITLSLNAGAYIAEIVRGGIKAVPVGQTEAARSLGLSYGKTMQKIILPQAFKIMIPSFINQFVISLKDTTILSAIGLVELLQSGKIIIARNLQSFKVYLIISIIYIVVITTLTKLSGVIERRISKNG